MKKSFVILILLILAQIGYLIFNATRLEIDRETLPSYRLNCKPYDPRDIFRGDYIRLDYEMDAADLHQSYKDNKDILPSKYDRHGKDFYFIATLKDRSLLFTSITNSYPENLEENELAIFIPLDFYPGYGKEKNTMVRDLIPDKYYVPESTGEIEKVWKEAYGESSVPPAFKFSIDFVPRKGQPTLLKELYVNDIPYNEAINLIQAKLWNEK